MKILTIVGARPQFIKSATFSNYLLKKNIINEVVVHTGQHFDSNMSDIFFKDLKIPKPKYFLNINSLTHGAMTGRMIEKIEEILFIEKPDWVLVYGDTNSTLAGALAAKKLNIKIAHIESGFRSFNCDMPEEINRILTDRMSNLLFCSTQNAYKNLINEGFNNFNSKIVTCGDILLESSLFYSNFEIKPDFTFHKDFALVTIHREENTNDKDIISKIMYNLEILSKSIEIIFPIHPRTKNLLNSINYNFSNSSINFSKPLSYLEILYLLKRSKIVVTDSGGLQKEAYFFQKPCLIIRNETEYIELINEGSNILLKSNFSLISKLALDLMTKNIDYRKNIFGTGNSSEIIYNEIINYDILNS
jgi:UDP-GlcNAc3NAcA epimerase